MKKKAKAEADDMPVEYDLDHARAKPNRFASKLPQGRVVGIVLAEDVAEVFESSEAVNRFLRSAIEAMPERKPSTSRASATKKSASRRAS